jgi:hypothetical protein
MNNLDKVFVALLGTIITSLFITPVVAMQNKKQNQKLIILQNSSLEGYPFFKERHQQEIKVPNSEISCKINYGPVYGKEDFTGPIIFIAESITFYQNNKKTSLENILNEENRLTSNTTNLRNFLQRVTNNVAIFSTKATGPDSSKVISNNDNDLYLIKHLTNYTRKNEFYVVLKTQKQESSEVFKALRFFNGIKFQDKILEINQNNKLTNFKFSFK